MQHIEGFKENVDSSLVNTKGFYQNIESLVLENRYMELYGMDNNCYECHKPMKIDVRKILRLHRINNTVMFCHDCRKKCNNHRKDPIFIKKKNDMLSFFKKIILDDSIVKLEASTGR